MVRSGDPAAGRGVRGKLTSDPDIQDAGVAVTFGLDPLWFLGLSPEDRDLAVAAFNVAVDIRTEALGHLVNHVMFRG